MSDSETSSTRPRLRAGPTGRPMFQLRIDRVLLNKIRGRAKSERLSVSAWMRQCAMQELRKKPKAAL